MVQRELIVHNIDVLKFDDGGNYIETMFSVQPQDANMLGLAYLASTIFTAGNTADSVFLYGGSYYTPDLTPLDPYFPKRIVGDLT